MPFDIALQFKSMFVHNARDFFTNVLILVKSALEVIIAFVLRKCIPCEIKSLIEINTSQNYELADKISKYAIPTHIQIKNLKNNRRIPKDEIPRLLVVHPSLSYFIILFIFYSIIMNNWFPQT